MVLEDLFNPAKVRHRPYLAFIFGFFFTFVAFLLSLFFFKDSMSVSVVFLTTLLLTPTLIMLLRMEEKIEVRFGLKNFFSNHKDIYEVYMFSFLGVFVAFVFVGLLLYTNQPLYNDAFEFQMTFLNLDQGVTQDAVKAFVDESIQPTFSQILGLFAHGLLVLMICFVLSFFYGASAIFLIILNASVFANFIVFAINTLTQNLMQGFQAFGFFLIHLLPEISGFMLAAIAGGVVSKAIMHEKKGSKAFKNVFKDATLLMLIAIALVLLAAVLEVCVTTRLFQNFF